MSYIQCVSTKTRLILTSDGKVSGINGETLQDDYKKICRINEKVAIAYAGNRVLCEYIITRLKSEYNNNLNVDQIFIIIKNICFEALGEHTKEKCQFIIGGIRPNGKLGMLTISSNNNYASLDYIPSDNHMCITNCTSDGTGSDLLEFNLKELFKNRPIQDIPEVLKVMNDTSRYMATIDNSVNNRIFREIIKL